MKKRTRGLSIIIILLTLSNGAGIYKVLFMANQFSKIFTFLPPEDVKWLIAIPLISIVSLAAIWFGRRWGIFLATLAFAVVLFLDVYYKVWAHAFLATAGFSILMFFCRQSRQSFRSPKISA